MPIEKSGDFVRNFVYYILEIWRLEENQIKTHMFSHFEKEFSQLAKFGHRTEPCSPSYL
jgi:hypothetical protein